MWSVSTGCHDRDVRRHPALQELSRDHQHALAVALKLRRAEPGAGAALRQFLAEPQGA
jgi:hypothetical protein